MVKKIKDTVSFLVGVAIPIVIYRVFTALLNAGECEHECAVSFVMIQDYCAEHVLDCATFRSVAVEEFHHNHPECYK